MDLRDLRPACPPGHSAGSPPDSLLHGPSSVSEELAAKVSRWLHRGGIPLEFAAARGLRVAGFEVSQGRGYASVGEDATKIREIDVFATISTDPDVHASVVAECKHTEKPWVVLTNERTLTVDESLSATVGHEMARERLRSWWQVVDGDAPEGDGIPALFEPPDLHGFAVVTADLGATSAAKDNDRNQARDAMAQAVGAAHGIVAARQFAWTLAWPVVVIDGPLIQVGWDDLGNEWSSEVERARVLWYASPYGSAVGVDIVRLTSWVAYAEMAYWAMNAVARRLTTDRRFYLSEENRDEYGLPTPLT